MGAGYTGASDLPALAFHPTLMNLRPIASQKWPSILSGISCRAKSPCSELEVEEGRIGTGEINEWLSRLKWKVGMVNDL